MKLVVRLNFLHRHRKSLVEGEKTTRYRVINMKRKIFRKNLVPTKRVAVVCFVLSIIAMLIGYVTTQAAQMHMERSYFIEETQQDTRERAESARNLLDGMVLDLCNTAEEIKMHENLWAPEVKEILSFSDEMNLFDATFVVDLHGDAYEETGYTFNVADQDYFKEAVKGNIVFSEALPSQRFEAIQIIAYPLYSDERQVEGVLCGLFNVETFSRLLNNAVNHDHRIYVVDSNGTYINSFDNNSIDRNARNFWEDISKRNMTDTEVEQLKSDFHARNDGEFSYEYKGVNRYGFHMPLGIQDWQLVLTAEETAVNEHILMARRIDFVDMIIDGVSLTVMLVCMYLYLKQANTEIYKASQKVKKNSEMLQMAVELSNHIIFEYDIKEHKIDLKTRVPNAIFDRREIQSVPDCFIELGLIEAPSVPALRSVFQEIETQENSEADIQMSDKTEGDLWYRVSLHNIYNDDGEIAATVGRAEDISVLKKGELAIQRREEMHRALVKNALLFARVDLDADAVVELNGKEINEPYQAYLAKRIVERVSEEYQSYVAQALSLEMLREEYQKGQEYIEVECVMTEPGRSKWVSCLVYRLSEQDKATVSFLITDIDKKKREALALQERAERDGLTGIYNAVTTKAKMNEVLCSKTSPEETHIFILFDLDDFKTINDTFGHAYGDRVLQDAAAALTECFRSNDIIGRLGGDEFAILLCNVRSDKYLDSFARTTIHALTKTYTKDGISIKVSASVGIAMAPEDGVTFDELYQKADQALYEVKRVGKNGYKRCE